MNDKHETIEQFMAELTSTGYDITRCKQAFEALQRSEANLQAIFNNMHQSFTLVGLDYRVQLTNQLSQERFKAIYGGILQEGTSILDITTAEDLANFKENFNRAGKGERVHIEQPIINPDNTVIHWYELEFVPVLDEAGAVTAVCFMTLDVSERKQAEFKLEHRALQVQVAAEVARDAAAITDLKELLERTVNLVRDRFGFYYAGIFLLDDQGEYAILQAAASDAGRMMLERGHKLKVGKMGIVGYVAGAGEPRIASNVEADDLHLKNPLLSHTRSEMALPLKVGEHIIGVLDVQSAYENDFSEGDVLVLQTMADQLAIAIENARLHAEMKQRLHQLAVLHELDQAIASSLRLDDIYYAYARQTERLLAYERMSITLLEGENLRVSYTSGELKNVLAVGTLLPLKTSAVGWVVTQAQPLIRHHITADRRFTEDELLVAAGIASMMIIPLRFKGRVIGTWNLSSRQIGAYGPDNLEIAQSMADQLAIALENAMLYQAEREQYRRLQQSQVQLIRVEKMAALGRLVASIAHEINNPLQAIQSSLTLLQEELEDRRRPEKLSLYLNIAGGEIDRIASLVRNLRDFYRPTHQNERGESAEAGTIDDFYRSLNREMQPVNLQTVLPSVLQLTRKQLQNKSITVETDWTDDLPPIQGNPDQLKQVFLNLTLNALDAMISTGGVLRIRISLNETRTNNTQLSKAVCIEFTDTGAGMPPEVLSQLFEPLFTTKEQGSGLGLFTSYKIIEAHRGHITVTSEIGTGTTFTILLPVAQPAIS
ncbi:MAG: GAF domain-containing protein [Chloroflexi bacterium]|nr:GAF domain-containing protein [Chloroflexota bacterium]